MIRAAVTALALGLSGAPALAADSPLAVVQALYREFAWEAVWATSAEPTFVESPRRRWRQYLSAELSGALHRERRCVERRRELCSLDFAPLWGSQDPAASDLRVRLGELAGEVQVEFKEGDSLKVLRLRMRREPSGWRVEDIVYPLGPSLRQILVERDRGHR